MEEGLRTETDPQTDRQTEWREKMEEVVEEREKMEKGSRREREDGVRPRETEGVGDRREGGGWGGGRCVCKLIVHCAVERRANEECKLASSGESSQIKLWLLASVCGDPCPPSFLPAPSSPAPLLPPPPPPTPFALAFRHNGNSSQKARCGPIDCI